MAAKFELYKDKKGEIRWKLVASNGQVIATSGEGYSTKENAKRGIESVKLDAPTAKSIDLEIFTNLFDKLRLHPTIIEASRPLFADGHYAQAIFEAFKSVDNFVMEKTNANTSGKILMGTVFDERNPLIKMNKLKTQSEKDEQEGFKFLFMGAMVGIRNPMAHKRVVQKDPYLTLEYLAFASLLIKRIDF